jgi:hypothetical protein
LIFFIFIKEKVIPKLTEGITLIQSMSIIYWIIDFGVFETQNIFDLSTRVQYTTNKKISIYFNANNLLNIRENNLKNNFLQTNILLQETSMNTLSGFANFGINYSF